MGNRTAKIALAVIRAAAVVLIFGIGVAVLIRGMLYMSNDSVAALTAVTLVGAWAQLISSVLHSTTDRRPRALRFSMRTLIIAMTLAGATLGLIAWAIR